MFLSYFTLFSEMTLWIFPKGSVADSEVTNVSRRRVRRVLFTQRLWNLFLYSHSRVEWTHKPSRRRERLPSIFLCILATVKDVCCQDNKKTVSVDRDALIINQIISASLVIQCASVYWPFSLFLFRAHLGVSSSQALADEQRDFIRSWLHSPLSQYFF